MQVDNTCCGKSACKDGNVLRALMTMDAMFVAWAHLHILIQDAGLQLHVLVYSSNNQDFIILRQCQDVGHCSTNTVIALTPVMT